MTTIILTGALCFTLGCLIASSITRSFIEDENKIKKVVPCFHCEMCCNEYPYRVVHLTETELQVKIERAYWEGRNAYMVRNTPLGWHNRKEILSKLKPAKKSMEELLKELNN